MLGGKGAAGLAQEGALTRGWDSIRKGKGRGGARGENSSSEKGKEISGGLSKGNERDGRRKKSSRFAIRQTEAKVTEREERAFSQGKKGGGKGRSSSLLLWGHRENARGTAQLLDVEKKRSQKGKKRTPPSLFCWGG